LADFRVIALARPRGILVYDRSLAVRDPARNFLGCGLGDEDPIPRVQEPDELDSPSYGKTRGNSSLGVSSYLVCGADHYRGFNNF
jgi:hypothetical protein